VRTTRREFLAVASAATMLPTSTAGAPQGQGSTAARWALGCHTRPFGTFRASQAANPDYILDAVKGAGYEFADMIAAGSPAGRNPAPSGATVYYTGKDPVKQLEIIGPHVQGVVAKDCSAPHFMERAVGDPPFGATVAGAGNPEVMIQFGTGKVDFAAFFKKLKSFGFSGPVMVEGTEVGQTLEQTIANARANREFLEKIFASV